MIYLVKTQKLMTFRLNKYVSVLKSLPFWFNMLMKQEGLILNLILVRKSLSTGI